MKWKQKLDEVGLTEQTASQGIRNKILDYNTIEDGIEELKNSIKEPTLNDDVDSLKKDLEDLTEALESQDDVLVKAITLFDKNKEHYAKLQDNLKNKRLEKGGKTSEKVNAPIPEIKQVEKQSNIAPILEPIGVSKEVPKKDNFSWLLLAGLAAVVTFGAVNIFKNND